MKAKWISAKEFADKQPVNLYGKERALRNKADETLRNKHIWYKKSFISNGGNYKINITADDYYKLYINGKFVGMGPSPAYHFCYNYNTFDVTSFIVNGENTITVHTYYQGTCNRIFCSGDLRQGLWMELFCDEKPVLVSDESFLYAYDPRFGEAATIGYETQFVENIDAAKTDYIWLPACPKQVDDYTLTPQITETCRRFEQLPKEITKLENGAVLYDFGEEIAGSLKISGAPENVGKVDIMYAEELQEDGHARFNMRCMENNRETWNLNGKDDVEAFDYRAFRYIELNGRVNPAAVSVMRREYPIKKELDFHCKNETLNQIYKICRNAVIVSTQETVMDCPTREKGQYLGDMAVTAIAHSHITGDTTMFKKALIDFSKSAFICKGLMCCVPGSFMQEIADYSLIYPFEVFEYYRLSKDIETVKQLLDTVLGVVEYFKAYEREDGLLQNVTEKWNLVDWPQNLRDGYDFPLTIPIGEGCHNVINAYYYGALLYAQKLCEIVGTPRDLGAQRVKDAYNKAFCNKETGLYVDAVGSDHTAIHSVALPLFFEMADNTKPLTDIIMEKGLNCGVYFSFFVLKGLVKAGRKDLALQLILNESEHSWVNMLREGATTCFEAWGKDQKWNTSLCHPWAAAPVILLTEDFADDNL